MKLFFEVDFVIEVCAIGTKSTCIDIYFYWGLDIISNYFSCILRLIVV